MSVRITIGCNDKLFNGNLTTTTNSLKKQNYHNEVLNLISE